jgi:hypothetical protein
LQQLASIGGIGAFLNDFPAVDTGLFGTRLQRVSSLFDQGEFHQTVDVFECQTFPGVRLLEGIHLDILDGTGVHLVAVALIWTVVAVENYIWPLGNILKWKYGVRMALKEII